MNWKNITEQTPPEKMPVLFYSKDLGAYLVGYWSEDENCMVQYPDDQEGWKWSVQKWSFINDLMPPTCTSLERAFLDELREKGKWSSKEQAIYLGQYGIITQGYFNTPLEGLVNE